MVVTWKEVSGSEDYQNLSTEDRDAVRADYFARVIVPQVETADLEAVHSDFMARTKPGFTDKALDYVPEFMGGNKATGAAAEAVDATAAAAPQENDLYAQARKENPSAGEDVIAARMTEMANGAPVKHDVIEPSATDGIGQARRQRGASGTWGSQSPIPQGAAGQDISGTMLGQKNLPIAPPPKGIASATQQDFQVLDRNGFAAASAGLNKRQAAQDRDERLNAIKRRTGANDVTARAIANQEDMAGGEFRVGSITEDKPKNLHERAADDISQIGNQLYYGTTEDAPQAVFQAIQWHAPEGGDVAAWAKEQASKYDSSHNQPDLYDKNPLEKTLILGARALPQSSAGMAAGIGTSLITKNPLTGFVVGNSIIAPLYAGSQAQQTYDKLIQAGAKPSDAKIAGWINYGIEGGGEALAGVIGGKLITGVGHLLVNELGKQGTKKALSTITSPSWLGAFAKDMLANAGIQSSTEYVQGFGETAVENLYGAKNNGSPHEAGKQGAIAALGMSLLLMPVAVPGHLNAAKDRANVGTLLVDETAPNEMRIRAASVAHEGLKKIIGKDAADAWHSSFVSNVSRPEADANLAKQRAMSAWEGNPLTRGSVPSAQPEPSRPAPTGPLTSALAAAPVAPGQTAPVDVPTRAAAQNVLPTPLQEGAPVEVPQQDDGSDAALLARIRQAELPDKTVTDETPNGTSDLAAAQNYPDANVENGNQVKGADLPGSGIVIPDAMPGLQGRDSTSTGMPVGDGAAPAQPPGGAKPGEALADEMPPAISGSSEARTPGDAALVNKQSDGLRTLDEEGRATDRKPINPGDVFGTLSGRKTTPVPKQKGKKYHSQWLIENATSEAESRGDSFNSRAFSNIGMLKGGGLTGADRSGMLMYLFGQQPAVVPPILKPFTVGAPSIADAKAKIGALKALQKSRLKPIDDARIHGMEGDLRAIAKLTGWAQEGGRMIRGSEDFNHPDYDKISRTTWIPHQEWYAGMANKISGQAAVNAVEDAIAGKPMNAKSKRFVAELMDIVAEERSQNSIAEREKLVEEASALGVDTTDKTAEQIRAEIDALYAQYDQLEREAIQEADSFVDDAQEEVNDIPFGEDESRNPADLNTIFGAAWNEEIQGEAQGPDRQEAAPPGATPAVPGVPARGAEEGRGDDENPPQSESLGDGAQGPEREGANDQSGERETGKLSPGKVGQFNLADNGKPTIELVGQTPEEILAEQEAERDRIRTAASDARAEEERAKRARAKQEDDARKTQVIADRKKEKKAEVDATVANFELGQEPPSPIVKKVTPDELAGQGDIFSAPQPTPAKAPAQTGPVGITVSDIVPMILRQIRVTIPAINSRTNTYQQREVSALDAIKATDDDIMQMKALLDCLKA